MLCLQGAQRMILLHGRLQDRIPRQGVLYEGVKWDQNDPLTA